MNKKIFSMRGIALALLFGLSAGCSHKRAQSSEAPPPPPQASTDQVPLIAPMPDNSTLPMTAEASPAPADPSAAPPSMQAEDAPASMPATAPTPTRIHRHRVIKRKRLVRDRAHHPIPHRTRLQAKNLVHHQMNHSAAHAIAPVTTSPIEPAPAPLPQAQASPAPVMTPVAAQNPAVQNPVMAQTPVAAAVPPPAPPVQAAPPPLPPNQVAPPVQQNPQVAPPQSMAPRQPAAASADDQPEVKFYMKPSFMAAMGVILLLGLGTIWWNKRSQG